LRVSAETLAAGAGSNHWLKLAVAAVIEDLYSVQRDLTLRIAPTGLDAWISAHRPAVERAEQLLTELHAAGRPDLAILTVANRQIRSLAEG
jgi:glutamate dehydrogenase